MTDSVTDGYSVDGSSSQGVLGGGADLHHTTAQRRASTPLKRVQSRVPVNDVTEQPLLKQARKLLDDQRAK